MRKYPEISNIDHVLPAIKGWDEFIVSDRSNGLYTVVNYTHQTPDTFSREYDGWQLRRECRGLIFNSSGELISRPFHKFFNVGELPETQIRNLDLSGEVNVYTKMDGSMVRPLLIHGGVRLATKMGITDVALPAETWIAHRPEMMKILGTNVSTGVTPIFEWVGPDNRIVVDYPENELVYLISRDNRTGEYFFDDYWDLYCKTTKMHDGDVYDLIKNTKDVDDEEGLVLHSINANGESEHYKVKSDWYVRLHRIKSLLATPRRIVECILKDEIDDIVPALDKEDQEKIRDIEKAVHQKINHIWGQSKDAFNHFLNTRMSRKDFALSDKPKLVKSAVFKGIDVWDRSFSKAVTEEHMRNKVKDMFMKSCHSEKSFESFCDEVDLEIEGIY